MATMTPAEFAETVNSTGREVRKFLRSETPKDQQPGKGSRWSLKGDKKSVTAMTKRFHAWKKAQLEAAAERAAKAAEEISDEVEETEDE